MLMSPNYVTVFSPSQEFQIINKNLIVASLNEITAKTFDNNKRVSLLISLFYMKGETSIPSLVLHCFKFLVAIETLIWETIQKLKNETFHKCQSLYLKVTFLKSLNSIVKSYSSSLSPLFSPQEVSFCQAQE